MSVGELAYWAARNGNTVVLAMVASQGQRMMWKEGTCAAAAKNGHVTCLQLLYRAGCPWGDACEAAAGHGHLDCLRYARDRGARCDARVCEAAAGGGYLDCLQFLHECGIACGESGTAAAGNGHLECLRYILDHSACATSAAVAAAVAGRLSCLKLLDERQVWSPYVCVAAAQAGRLACLQYALVCMPLPTPMLERLLVVASEHGHLDCLMMLHQAGATWLDGSPCFAAAFNGHVDCLAYLHAHGCPCDEQDCVAAARGGHLAALKFLHLNGCPWDEGTLRSALLGGHLPCARFARARGCPCYACDRYLVVRKLLLPEWRALVRVRAIAIYWQGRAVQGACAEGGAARKRDRTAFEAEFA